MAGRIDYKQKYEELKAKFMSSVDASWRDGYQHGLQDSQVEQAAQQQEADAMAAAQPGQPGEEQPAEGEQPEAEEEAPISQNPNGDELGQHIEKLESMLGKSEISSFELQDLKKTLNDIRSLQVYINLTKSRESAKSAKMAKPYTPIKMTPKLQANLPDQSKKALTLQHEIIANVFKKWENDSARAASGIGAILNSEGITKKE
jgi:hypothetical protein